MSKGEILLYEVNVEGILFSDLSDYCMSLGSIYVCIIIGGSLEFVNEKIHPPKIPYHNPLQKMRSNYSGSINPMKMNLLPHEKSEIYKKHRTDK